MNKKTRFFWNRIIALTSAPRVRIVSLAISVVLLGYLTCAGVALWRGEKMMTEKGFMVLAAETLQPYREILSYSARGCRALLQANYEGRFLDRAEWAAESCLNHGHEISEAYVALAGVRESTGREEEAMQILRAASERFREDATVQYKLARLLVKAGRLPEALNYMNQAAAKVPQNIGVQVETLAFMIQQKEYALARSVVERLKSVPPKDLNAIARMLMAEVLVKLGDAGSAKELAQQAGPEWKTMQPAQQERVRKVAPEAVRLVSK